jgi:mRNA interferase HigB
MKILNRRILMDYGHEHPDARLYLQAWFHMTRHANWTCPADIRAEFTDAGFITRDWVSLPLKSASCRLVMQVNCPYGLVILRHITFYPQEHLRTAAEMTS